MEMVVNIVSSNCKYYVLDIYKAKGAFFQLYWRTGSDTKS